MCVSVGCQRLCWGMQGQGRRRTTSHCRARSRHLHPPRHRSAPVGDRHDQATRRPVSASISYRYDLHDLLSVKDTVGAAVAGHSAYAYDGLTRIASRHNPLAPPRPTATTPPRTGRRCRFSRHPHLRLATLRENAVNNGAKPRPDAAVVRARQLFLFAEISRVGRPPTSLAITVGR
jgi:hypothetical protein